MNYQEFQEVVYQMSHGISKEEFCQVLTDNGQSEVHHDDLWKSYKGGKMFWLFNGIDPKKIGEDIFNLVVQKVKPNQ